MFGRIDEWQEQLDVSQLTYVPLILNCLLAVQVLSTIRDPIVMDNVPQEVFLFDGISIALLLALAIAARQNKISAKFSHPVVVLALWVVACKAIFLVVYEQEPYPLYIAVILFSSALCFLRYQFYILTSGLIVMPWVAASWVTLSMLQLVSTLTICVVACVLGFFVLDRRIESLIRIFILQQRVKALENVVPICAGCKKIRNPEGAWKSIEEYVESEAGVAVSHGMCSECSKELYGDYLKARK